MPVYVFIANLIVKKSAVAAKYPGGVAQFRSVYANTYYPDARQEDNELFVFHAHNAAFFNLGELTGLHWNQEEQYSEDFVIVERYNPKLILWEADWLCTNTVFCWHADCAPNLIAEAKRIEHMSLDEITTLQKAGNNLLKSFA